MYSHELEKLTDDELSFLGGQIRKLQITREALKFSSYNLNEDEKKLSPIEAIKAFRNRIGCSLLFAKDTVDRYRDSLKGV